MRKGGVTGKYKVSNAAIRLVYVKDGVVWKERARRDENVGCEVCGMCERVVVVLWAGWIGKNVWRGDEEMIVGDIDGNVRSKFR